LIHYHGTPLTPRAELQKMAGKHFCVSFARPDDAAWCLSHGQSVMWDNGAFSFYTRKQETKWNKFYTWLESRLCHPHWAVIPDVIDGTVEENWSLIKEWPHRKDCAAPVWHLNESIERLERLANEWPRISFGSTTGMTPGSKKFWVRMASAMEAVCDAEGRPRCKLHGLRMLDPNIFSCVPFASSDSANAALNSFMYGRNFGIYQPQKRSQRANVIADRIESCNSAPVWNPNGSILIQEEIQLCGQ